MGRTGLKHRPPTQIGDVFGRLTVIGFEEKDNKGRTQLLCRCECGNEKVYKQGNLRIGDTKSCGCYKKDLFEALITKHGLYDAPLHYVWSGIKNRCYNKNSKSWEYYGGKGIKMCDKWRDDFKCFHDDVISGYAPGLDLDRISSEGNYEPGNVQWLTSKENNRKNNRVKIGFQNAALIRTRFASAKDMALIFGVCVSAISRVLNNQTWYD